MKMAKASEADIETIVDFFNMLEEVIEHGTFTPDDDSEPNGIDDEQFLKMIRAAWQKRGGGVGTDWRRVVFGCDTLIKNCCDPNLDYLEWRPDVRAFVEAQEQVKETEKSGA